MLKKQLSIAIPAALATLLVPALAFAAGDAAGPCNEESFLDKGWLWLYIAAFGNGLLTSLTPCVYPMIPITVAVFGAREEGVGRLRAFGLATSYVFGMGAMYSILGVVVTLLGQQFGTFLSNPWVVVPLVILFALLAASMFGAFELNLPGPLQNRFNQIGGKGYGGAFGMGLVGGFVAAPCTGPFLALILGPVMETQNVFAGATMLFTYALGIGVLFWLIAVFAVALPKSGQWMEWIKSFGGIALIAVAVYFLRPIVPAIAELTDPGLTFLLSSIGVALIGLAVGAVHLSFHDDWSVKIRKALGVLLVVMGSTGVINWALTPDQHLPWQYEEEPAFAQAKAEGKGVMIDVAADWCLPCKELEHTFADPEVYQAIVDNFVPVKYDVTKGTDLDEQRQEKWHADTLPAVIFIDAEGNEIARVREYLPPDKFLEVVRPAAEKLHTKLTSGEPCPK
ncbi:MAG: thioredoxin family protein [Proteobacteria bacterium]|nr:thioredoxin family protein [Pseudomonadota bacterium]